MGILVLLTALLPMPDYVYVQVRAVVIRHSSLTDGQKGEKFAKLIKKDMTDDEVRLIIGQEERPIIFGNGFNSSEFWYLNHGVIVGFLNNRVTDVLYRRPPVDNNGAPIP